MISRDHSATWTVCKPAFSVGNECQTAQLGDGSIMLNIRNDYERFLPPASKKQISIKFPFDGFLTLGR